MALPDSDLLLLLGVDQHKRKQVHIYCSGQDTSTSVLLFLLGAYLLLVQVY